MVCTTNINQQYSGLSENGIYPNNCNLKREIYVSRVDLRVYDLFLDKPILVQHQREPTEATGKRWDNGLKITQYQYPLTIPKGLKIKSKLETTNEKI
jgi:hypothetical protein